MLKMLSPNSLPGNYQDTDHQNKEYDILIYGQNMTFGGLRKKKEKKKKKKKKKKKEKKRKKKKRDFPMRLYTQYNTLSSALLEIFGRDGGLFSSPVIASC